MRKKHAKKFLFQKTGFEKTLRILYENPEIKREKEFFVIFNKESYYNAYFRVKPQMIELSLIKVKKRSIELTEKGKTAYLLLKTLIDQTNGINKEDERIEKKIK